MNPNAKEFVPAHLMRKRQEEAMGSLAKQLGDVDLDESKKVGEGKGETSCDTQQNSTRTSSTTNDKTQNETSTGNEDSNNRGPVDASKETTDPSSASSEQQQHHKAQNNNSNNNERSKNNLESNGEPLQDYDVDDRYLLRAGENYCEFNGEQFIIPGE